MVAKVLACSVGVEGLLLGQDQHAQALIRQECAPARIALTQQEMHATFDLDGEVAYRQ